jgi:hypothetical protein
MAASQPQYTQTGPAPEETPMIIGKLGAQTQRNGFPASALAGWH